MLQYYGVYAPPPLEAVVSPNGDGVAETQQLTYKIVRPSTVSVTLTAPDGTVAFQESGAREPGTYDVAFPPLPPPPPPPEPAPTGSLPPAEGRWTFTVSSTDDQGLPSTTTRRFTVNSTLGSLRVAPTRVVVRPTGGRADILWSQARAARVKVTIETPEGILVRTVTNATLQAGDQRVIWDGRGGNRKPVAGGRYIARVTATNELGSAALTQELIVRRVTS
jgi:hypothetical protein